MPRHLPNVRLVGPAYQAALGPSRMVARMSAAIDWGRRRQACPACGRGPRDTALSVSPRTDGTYIAHCFRCGSVFFSDERANPSRACKAALQDETRRELLSRHGRELWRACRPISGPARAYLEARGCVIPPPDGDLRWHPRLRHPSGYEGPAMVALLRDAVDGTPRTLHRTWIRPDGRKADVDPPRLLLGNHRKAGAVCRLWASECVTYGLGVAEGIETALSLAHAFKPVWACVDAGNLAALPVLEGVESLTVAADHDDAGIAAARACAQRWRAAGREVRIVMPGTTGADLNDEVQDECVA
jgi:hypothetical protein